MTEEHDRMENGKRIHEDTEEKDREIERLKQELDLMRKQQQEILNMLKTMQEQQDKTPSSRPETRTSKRTNDVSLSRKAVRISRRLNRKARDLEKTVYDLENVVEDFVTSLLSSIASSVGYGARLVLDVGHPKTRQKKDEDRWSKVWKELSHQNISEDELEDFFESMAQVSGVLNDKHRIRLLKALERHPCYYDELSELTGLKGGQFRHHMSILKDNHLVVQERYRGRYILTPFGRSLLKLLEVLYMRYLSPRGAEDVDDDLGEENEENIEKKDYKRIIIDEKDVESESEEE